MSRNATVALDVSASNEVRAPAPAVLGFKQSDVGLIPEDWEVKRLGDLASFRTGPFGSALHKSDYTNGGVPIINPMHIINARLLPTITMSVSESAAIKLCDFRLQKNDLIIGRRGDMGRCAVVKERNVGWLCGTGSMIVRPSVKTNSDFLQRILSSPDIISKIESLSVGSTMINLNQATLSSLLIKCPPAREQRAIASALIDVDALLEELDKLIAKKRDIKQATMQQLLTGQTRLPGFDEEWEVTQLGDVAVFYKGRGLPKSAIDFYGQAQCIHYGELFTQYGVSIDKTISRTNNDTDVFLSVANDVLMPTSDVTPNGLAKASCVTFGGVILGGDILVIRADPDRINGIFLSYIIRNEEAQVLRLVTGSTVYHLYGSDMQNFTFKLPKLAEQGLIVKLLSDMDTDIHVIEQRRNKTAALKQAMMQELLTGRTRLI